ncbi:polysaccharide pyruvyl transferase family protein [Aliisedimentitalea scapharcae]|uniref:Polysaccharide pyruvyl transferase family protein n=1 Tax=Aliisedimentitalea scapharcae TaxID=1524259 RepID=A0ABZ2XQ17_9RHOB
MDAVAGHNTPLRLFWWKGVANFGDALSQIVVAHASGRDVVHSGIGGADLVAVGSIIQIVRRKFANGGTGRPVIWGSGVLHPTPKDFLEHVDVALVRGPITAALLGLKTDQFGDPGLLIAEALGEAPQPTDRIGLVPHHKQVDDPIFARLVHDHDQVDLIDVRADAATVCQQIARCHHVFASSLHGLITADAYGVPSTWADPGEESHLKYHDYAASVGRAMIAPIDWDTIPDHLNTLPARGPLSYAAGIKRAQAALHNSFPVQMRTSTYAGAT